MFFILFINFIYSKSETDCFNINNNLWNINQNIKFENETYYLNIENTEINYNSERFRKKWMLNFCGDITNSFFSFNSKKNEDFDLNNGVIIHIIKNEERGNYRVKFLNNGNILSTNDLFPRKTEKLCFSIVSGRGYVGLFSLPNIDGKSPVFLIEFEIPRNNYFKYISKKQSFLEELCLGDFLGQYRHENQFNDNWDLNVKDFL